MNDYIPFVSPKHCCKIWLDDIVYIEQTEKRVIVVTKDKVYKKSGRVEEYKDMLNRCFYPCLKNTLINFNYVDSVSEQYVFFSNGLKYFLGRENYLHTKQSFAMYLLNPELFFTTKQKDDEGEDNN